MDFVLNEFDENKDSILNPNESEKYIEGFPKIGVTCWSQKLMNKLIEHFDTEEIALSKNGNSKLPIYKINYNGKDIAIFLSRLGASACVVQYEELFVMGLEKVVAFGTCGVLDSSIKDLAIIIPTSAVRDEGTSYHYMKPTREVEVNSKYKDEFIEVLKKNNYSYTLGKAWTTDAPYRETKDKIKKRKEEGCICVDMECSAINVLAKYRNKEIFQFFYAADNLDAAKWESRSLSNDDFLSGKEKIGLLAIEFASML